MSNFADGTNTKKRKSTASGKSSSNDKSPDKRARLKKSSFGKKQATKSPSPSTNNPNQSSSSQKRALKQERQSHRRHADVVKDSKDIWNKLRMKTNTKDDINSLMDRLMILLYHTETTLSEIALQHDASRVVQAAIQFANESQRCQICKSLQMHIPAMSKSQYAHFCVLKLLQYAHRDLECVKMLVKSFRGHVCQLAVHSVGARVVELLFSTLPAKHTNVLRQEFYGPHFSKFALDVTSNCSTPKKAVTLQSNIELQPDKKEAACEFVLNNLIQKGMDKGLYGFAYYQQILNEYVTVVGHEKDLIANLVDHSLHLLSTRSGTQVVLYCISYGTAKDRKRILKALKGYTRSSLLHRDAYLAILQLVLVTDDTVSIYKSLLAELLTMDPEKQDPMNQLHQQDPQQNNHPLLEIALHDKASKLFLMLLVSDSEGIHDPAESREVNKFLDPLEQSLLQRNPMVLEQGVPVPTCKKNHNTRRKELLQYMAKPLEQLCLQHTNQLARSLPGSRVMHQVWIHAPSNELTQNLVDLCCGLPCSPESDSQDTLLNDPIGHYLVKNLVTTSKHPSFAHALAKAMEVQMISCSRAAFVVAALLHSSERSTVLHRIPKLKFQEVIEEQLNAPADTEKPAAAPCAGFQALLQALVKDEP